MTRPFPFTIFSAAGGGVPDIPESITARENLSHWYKMNEGSTSAVTDVGLNADSTDMTLVGVSSAGETGPSAIGSPDAIQFDGAIGVGSVVARTGGENTPLGDLFNTNTFSVSWWMKDTTTPNGSSYNNWITTACYACPGWPWIGWGVRYYYGNFFPWQNVVTQGTYAGGFSTGIWRHYTLTFDGASLWEFWINGVKTGYNNGTINTFPDLVADDMYLSIAGIRWQTGGAGTFQGDNDPYYSDLRFYDIQLSDANIASIYAGDW